MTDASSGNLASGFHIRPYAPDDLSAVIALWETCGLVVPWNDPQCDIRRKLDADSAGFLVGELDTRLVASVMAGYEGHRGWLNYLAVDPGFRGKGLGRDMVQAAEALLLGRGCPKVNLQIRAGNVAVAEFYRRLGYRVDAAVGLGKRLIPDTSEAATAVDADDGLRIQRSPPSVDEYLRLRVRAGMSSSTPEAAALGLPRSLFAVSVYRRANLIGMGRVVGDGGCNFIIVDVAVDPDRRRQGLGRRIMEEIMSYLARNAPPGAHVSVLADVPEFYENIGFRRMAPASEAMYWAQGSEYGIQEAEK
ncbi:MAG: GNAT family acetyltransferase [Acidihalobacter sp.]|jgi:ribosomal protein S18 acetylase RimI-like enzyme